MIDMLAKILIFGLLATAAIASPIGPAEDDDDLPVYTEKVLPGKPTQVPKFGSKKISIGPRKEPEKLSSENKRPYGSPVHTTSVPKPILKTAKPIRSNTRPVRRTNRIPITPSVGYNEIQSVSSSEYEGPPPSFDAVKGLGVEYAPEVEAPSSHEDLVEDYKPRKVQHEESAPPRRLQHQGSAAPRRVQHQRSTAPIRVQHQPSSEPIRFQHQPSSEPIRVQHQPSSAPRRAQHQTGSDIGSAVGNAPQLLYAVAPQSFASAAAPLKDAPDYNYGGNAYDEKPQPYIFGYELKDENGSTQSRKEQGDDYGNKRGSYAYTDGYGIYRQVEYVADEHGFRAVVKTNEPGTENQNPADVEIHSEAEKY